MIELTEREPHDRTYVNPVTGQRSVIHVDRLGSVRMSEELLHSLLVQLGNHEVIESLEVAP
jgi:hypothetical protein